MMFGQIQSIDSNHDDLIDSTTGLSQVAAESIGFGEFVLGGLLGYGGARYMQSRSDTVTAEQIATLQKELEYVKEKDQTHEAQASYNIATKEAEFAKQKLDEDTELAKA